jgi:Protein kinase domain
MARRRGPLGRDPSPKTTIEVGTRIDGYRVERIVSRREGLNTLAEAATLRGERVTLDVLATPLKDDRELRRRVARLVPLRASIDHPNILRLLKAVDGGQRLHLESIPRGAGTLADLLAEGPLERTQALRILGQIAGALETARAKGLTHRALSPRSIVVQPGEEPRVLLTDFGIGAPRGLACELPAAVEDAGYRAPEEIRGEAPEAASNVYSLTCILVECLTGSTPYPYSRPLAAIHAHLTEPPPRLTERDPELPAGLDEVVGRGMAKDPREREVSPAALVNEVAHALGLHVPIPVVRAPRKQQAAAPARERRPAPEPPARRRAKEPRPTGKALPPPHAKAPQAREKAPRRGDHAAPAPRRSRGLVRRAPAWAALALAASAVAGFATGNTSSAGNTSPPDKATKAVHQAQSEPAAARLVVSRTVDRLDARRAAIRKRLNRARRARGQATAARRLAAAYGTAETRIARAASSGAEEQLAERLSDVKAAYLDLAAAARRTDRRDWQTAGRAALEGEREVELLLRTHSWR